MTDLQAYEKEDIMFKRLLVALVSLILLCTGTACLAESEEDALVRLDTPDLFLEEHQEDSIPYTDSETFEVWYRVCMEPDAPLTESGQLNIRFQLAFRNRTNRPLKGFQLTFHMTPAMQTALVNSQWYNSPCTLGAHVEDHSDTYILTWDALLDPYALRSLGGFSLDMAYNVMAEVQWRTGLFSTHSEILRFSEEDCEQLLSVPWVQEDVDAPLLDEEALALLNERLFESSSAE